MTGAAAEHETHVVLPDLSGTWAVVGATGKPLPTVGPASKEVLCLFRHQPSNAAAAAPNSVYAREIDGNPRGHCWLTPTHGYGTRRLEQVELWCDGPRRHKSHAGNQRGHVGPPDATPAAHNATIHTVLTIYMNHYDVGYTGYVNDVDNKYMHDYFPQKR
jgi:hypothetical protein